MIEQLQTGSAFKKNAAKDRGSYPSHKELQMKYQTVLTQDVRNLPTVVTKSKGVEVKVAPGASLGGGKLELRYKPLGSAGIWHTLDKHLVSGYERSYLISSGLEIAIRLLGSTNPNISITVDNLIHD